MRRSLEEKKTRTHRMVERSTIQERTHPRRRDLAWADSRGRGSRRCLHVKPRSRTARHRTVYPSLFDLHTILRAEWGKGGTAESWRASVGFPCKRSGKLCWSG